MKRACIFEALSHTSAQGRLSKEQIRKESKLLSEAMTQKSLLKF